MPYASETTVSVGRTKAHLEKMLIDYGATGIAMVWDEDSGEQLVQFKVRVGSAQRVCQLRVLVPALDEFKYTPTRKVRVAAQMEKMQEQELKSRWRFIYMLTKMKLECIERGAAVFEEEFLSTFVLPSGCSVAQEVVPRLCDVLDGNQPLLLAAPRG